MSRPITWQSLSNHNLPDPTRLIAMGQEGLNAGMSGFQKMTDNYLQGQQNIVDKTKVDNKEALLTSLYGIKTVADMEAVERSGVLDAQLAGYGDKVNDRAGLLQAIQGRKAVLQGQTTANMTYGNAVLDQEQLPERERLTLQALQNVPGAAEAIANSNLRVKSDVMKTAMDRSRQSVTDKQTADKTASELLTSSTDRGLKTAQTGVLNSQVTDTLLNRTLANRVATSGLETATKIGEAQTKFGTLAASLGMPVSRGFVDTDTLTVAQKRELDAAGEKTGIGTFSDIPTMSSAFRSISGDLAKESPDAARVVAANQDAFLGQFKASGITTEYGAYEDRVAKVLAKAKERNVYNDDKGNPALSPTDMTEEIQKYVKTVVPKDNQEAMLKQMSKHIAKGYELPDGTKVPYPLGAVKEAINQTDYPWWGNFLGIRDKSGDATSRLDEWMTQPSNTDRVVEGLGTLSAADRKLFTDDLLAKGGSSKSSKGRGSFSSMRSGTPPGYKSPVTVVKNPGQ